MESVEEKAIRFLQEYEIEIAPFKAGHRFYMNPKLVHETHLGYLINSRKPSAAYSGYMVNALEFLRDCKKAGAIFKRKL
jgi:hypothetical protein